MNKLKNILISGTLSVCMVVGSLPIETLAQEQEAVQGQEEAGVQENALYEIVSFEELTEEVKKQNVPVETVLEELKLPETLTVFYRLYTEEQDGGEETDQGPEDNAGSGENESVSGNGADKGNESASGGEAGDKGNENMPGGEIGDKGNENNPGGETVDGGSESNPGGGTGSDGNENVPGEDAEDKGNENISGGEAAEGGNESNPGGGTGSDGNESTSGGEAAEGGNESNPGDGSGDGGSEGTPEGESGTEENGSTSGGESEGGGSESAPDGGSAQEVVVARETVEVHMKEYQSQPEFTVETGTVTPDGQEAYSGESAASGQEADGETENISLESDQQSESDAEPNEDPGISPDSGTDTSPAPDINMDPAAGTEPKPDSETNKDPALDSSANMDGNLNPDLDTDTEAGTDMPPAPDSNTDIGVGADAGQDPEKNTDTNTNPDPGINTEAGADQDGNLNPDTNTDTESSPNEDSNISQTVESVVIEDVTWLSTPEYDGNTEGRYLFTPVLPESYVLGEGVVLPEIAVTVGEVFDQLNATAVPACGTISTDTVWNDAGTLSDGELIVEPGVTLTINNRIDISGIVTIKGGGTIKRGSGAAYLRVNQGADLTVGKITLEGSSISSSDAMIFADNAKILLDDGCRIQNCRRSNFGNYGSFNSAYSGAALYVYMGEAVLNDVNIEGCRGAGYGGAICLSQCKMTVNGGTYRNNRDGGAFAGSVLYNICSKLYIYGGNFIDNTAEGSLFSACIVDIAQVKGSFSNETHIYGGYFEGNKKASQGYGGGALLLAASYGSNLNDAIIELAGDVRFCGDGVESSGTDGFYLDFVNYPRKVSIGSPLTSPVYIHLKAKEGYVIAKGSSGYTLTEKDMKQIRFTDVNNSGKQWYAWLDKEKNEIYLSEKKPPYGLYVYYSSNGATGTVTDDTEYASGADVMVKSADALSKEESKFKEWNTKPDGTGTPYSPGSSFKITNDITLYAIFKESKSIDASFYSGGAGRREVISEVPGENADSVTITAPELKEMDGWKKVGWDKEIGGYKGAIAPDSSLTISEDTSYYGVYSKDVTLSYNANGGKEDEVPGNGTGECRANVHDKITYDMLGLRVAGGITAANPDWVFVGWNTKQDGTGDSYEENDIIKIAEDTTLYATFVKPPYAFFYSGDRECDKKGSNVFTGKVIAPHLKEKRGWEEIGWDEDTAGYEGSIKPGEELALANDEDYYGVYRKAVTLSYLVLKNEYKGDIPEDSTQLRKEKVCETEILCEPKSDNPDAFVFDIAPDLAMDGYDFLGWNTSADGTGDFYRKEDVERNQITVTEDTVLYGIFGKSLSATFYSGPAGECVTVPSTSVSSDATGTFTGMLTTPALKEMEGWEPIGWSRSEAGYEESVETAGGQDVTITEDTVYYGVYKKKVELSYDANGWQDAAPAVQSRFRYANVHGGITYTPSIDFTVGQDISREGYTFRGWTSVKDAGGVADSDYYKPEDTIKLEDSAILYAQMVDDIAPVLGEATYSNGYRNIKDWIVRKKDLVLTVPVTEKGSGVNKIVYTFTPESGEPVTGEALMEDAGEPRQVVQEFQAAVWLEAGVAAPADGVVEGGSSSAWRTLVADSESAGRTQAADTTSAGQISSEDHSNGAPDGIRASGGEVGTDDGQIQAKITVSEDYKGSISLLCRDNAGNESPLKLLTTQGGGVIVEDNAPQISFQNKENKNGKAVVEVTVYDNADENSNNHITGGIASVSFVTDNKQAQDVTDKGFAEGIVESCTFEVEVSGVGEHTIDVTAVDNAGNESSRSTSVKIAGNNRITTVIKASTPPAGENGVSEPPAVENSVLNQPEKSTVVEPYEPEAPMDKEPRTRDNSLNVEVCATIAMISGLLYVLLYFTAEQGGMTESEKNEAVARLIAWAKKGGKLRRYVAIVAIFFVLFYYYSIGKSSAEGFKVSI